MKVSIGDKIKELKASKKIGENDVLYKHLVSFYENDLHKWIKDHHVPGVEMPLAEKEEIKTIMSEFSGLIDRILGRP